MKFKVMGHVFKDGERCTICYDEFEDYPDAHDYKEWLENPDNWKGKLENKPYIVYIKEVKSEGEKYFDNAMENEE